MQDSKGEEKIGKLKKKSVEVKYLMNSKKNQ